ncbi:MAG TPA: hypothetical protein VNM15_07930 [Candidatus Binatia bacterium]|jgi:hypothetical protein|nr:hypothetical protein [Candidatus Binatia bacterium]
MKPRFAIFLAAGLLRIAWVSSAPAQMIQVHAGYGGIAPAG